MKVFSNNQAARKLGISPISLSRYVKAKKVPTPKMLQVGDSSLHAWTEAEIEHVRKLLPKIANGRKTRYTKQQSALSNQQSAKTKKKTQARAPAVQKKRKSKKK